MSPFTASKPLTAAGTTFRFYESKVTGLRGLLMETGEPLCSLHVVTARAPAAFCSVRRCSSVTFLLVPVVAVPVLRDSDCIRECFPALGTCNPG